MYKQFVTYEAQYDNHDHQLCVFPPHCTLYERAINTRLYAYPPRRYLQLRAPLLECECLLVQVISLVDKQFDTFTSLKNTLCSLVIKDSTLNVFQCPCVPILCTITSLTCSISPWTCLSLSEFGLFEKYSYTLHVNADALFFLFYSLQSVSLPFAWQSRAKIRSTHKAANAVLVASSTFQGTCPWDLVRTQTVSGVRTSRLPCTCM